MTSSTERFQVAVVGLGRMGSGYDSVVPSELPRSHVAAILANPALDLAAVCDSRAEARAAFITDRKLQVPVFESLEQIFAYAHYDMVVVATDATSHEQVLQACLLARPQIVFCEKPFCGNARIAARLAEEFSRQGIELVINYHRRWDERFGRLREAVQESGPIRHAELLYMKGLRNYGAHAIDLLQFLFGSVRSVAPSPRIPSVVPHLADPSYSAILAFDEGLLVNMVGFDDIYYELLDLDIVTQSARFNVASGGHAMGVCRFEEGLHFQGYANLSAMQPLCAPGPVHGLTRAYEEFVQFLRGSSPMETSPAANAVSIQRTMDAIDHVASGGKRIVL